MAEEFVQVVKLKVDDSELRAAIDFMKKELGTVGVTIGSKITSATDQAATGAEKIGKGFSKADKEAKKTAKDAKDIAKGTKEAKKETDGLAKSFKGMAGAVKSLVAAYAGFKGVSALIGFGKGSIDAFTAQKRAELQLDTVLKNRGAGYASGYIKGEASRIQQRTTIGDESMIAGAAELATYVKDPRSLKRMMNLLADYSMGMTGGAELSPEALTNLATGLGKAFDGSYDAMRKKGFDTSELETIENALKLQDDLAKGNIKTDKKTGELKLSSDDKELLKWLKEHKGQNIEELKITALENALEDWKGLAEEFANTDEGKLQQLKNTIGDMREEVGRKLLPVVGKLANELKANLPTLEQIFDNLRDALVSIIEAVRDNLENIRDFAKVISELVSFIADHIQSIVAFSVALKAIKVFAPGASTGLGLVAAGIIGLAAAAIETSKKLRKARQDRRYGEAQEAVDNYVGMKNRIIRLKKQGKTFDPLTGQSVSQMEASLEGLRQKAGNAIRDYAKNEVENGQYAGVDQEWLDSLGVKPGGMYFKMGGRKINIYGKDANGEVTGLADWRKREQEFFGRYEDYKNEEMLKAKGNTTNNYVKVTNNITTDSDLVAKAIKENLRTLLTSQLNFTSRTSAAKALAI